MSETPRTDHIQDVYYNTDKYVVSDLFYFARNLEIELNAANQHIKRLKEASDYDKMTPQQKRQYDKVIDMGWRYDKTKDGKVYVTSYGPVINRGYDIGDEPTTKKRTIVIEPDGSYHEDK